MTIRCCYCKAFMGTKPGPAEQTTDSICPSCLERELSEMWNDQTDARPSAVMSGTDNPASGCSSPEEDGQRGRLSLWPLSTRPTCIVFALAYLWLALMVR